VHHTWSSCLLVEENSNKPTVSLGDSAKSVEIVHLIVNIWWSHRWYMYCNRGPSPVWVSETKSLHSYCGAKLSLNCQNKQKHHSCFSVLRLKFCWGDFPQNTSEILIRLYIQGAYSRCHSTVACQWMWYSA
jgi:hypothetical protein